jgi:serine/threonine protein kinase
MSDAVYCLLPPDVLDAIDPPSSIFDRLWQQGKRPAIEDHLGAVADAVRPLLREELIRIELEWRYRLGEAPETAEYRGRFPTCADAIEGWLAEARAAAESVVRHDPAATGSYNPISTPTPDGTPIPDTQPPADTGPPPQLLGEYELLERLGAGGMGEVYKARHRRLGKLVALKLLPAGAHRSGQALARFLREMRAVGTLDHPNVVEAHDAGERAGTVYLVMKLVEGTDLGRLVRARGPLPVTEACDLARQAALGLQYLHERGLVHRDVKPSNLMRMPDGVVKVLDLGLARWQAGGTAGEDLTGTGLVVGTPDFLAPEQFSSGATVDIRADLYGLGGTLFYLLTGWSPFADRAGIYEKLEAHRRETPPDVRKLRPEVPAALADIVARLLAKRPDDRLQTPAEVAAALAEFAEKPSPARSRLPSPSRRRWGRRARLLAGAGGLALLLAGVAVAFFWDGRPGLPRPQTEPAQPGEVPPAGEPVRVLCLDVRHFANVGGQFDQPRGLLGRDSFDTRRDDSVTVEARLSRQAYAYLIAFRPNGTEELCFPEKEDEPPPLTDRPRYPSVTRGVNYGLNEGAGLQAFALVVSAQPLPAYKEWRAGRGPSPWKKAPAAPGVVWRDDGADLLALTIDDPTGQRGKGQEVVGKTPVAALTDWLRQDTKADAVAAVGFAVRPRGKP